MITVAVTGGIGAGKSTVSRRLADLGAVVVDSDRLAREVVAPGSAGLAEIAEVFGPGVIAADGSLLRPALAAIVFADPAARARLEAITHPRVRDRFEQERAAAPADAVVVNDIPLLVDLRVAARFHLVLTVRADPAVRVARLVGRGLTETDARARIAAQISDADRDPLTDAWLDNDGDPDALERAVDQLWRERLVPFERNVRLGRVAAAASWPPTAGGGSAPAGGGSPADGAAGATGSTAVRLAARVGAAVPGAAVTVLSPTEGAGGPVRLRAANVDPRLLPALTAAGFPPLAADGPPATHGETRRHGAADPGRPAEVQVLLGLR